MKKVKHLIIALVFILLTLSAIFVVWALTDDSGSNRSGSTTAAEITAAVKSKNIAETEEDNSDTWAIYLYICGSDLESRESKSTRLLQSIKDSGRTKSTIVVAETGGTKEWHDKAVSADKIQRWLYADGDKQLVEELDQANMGDPDTLEDFLRFASTNYPADHTMFIFWDHGAGLLRGCCFDENYNNSNFPHREAALM